MNTRLATLEDILWDDIGFDSEPRFVFPIDDELSKEALLHVIPLSKPFFGRARFLLASGLLDFVDARFNMLHNYGLLSYRALNEADSWEDALVFVGENIDLLRDFQGKMPRIIYGTKPLETSLPYRYLEETPLELKPKDPAYEVHAALSVYGRPIEEFSLREKTSDEVFPRDWHFLGPSRDYVSYRVVRDEILLGLLKNEGAVFPRESYDVLSKAINGEEVSGPELYHALRACYQTPCYLRDMAAYQHDTWMLRTFAFVAVSDRQAPMILPYAMLIQNEKRHEGLLDEEYFPQDILFSDFLVPLLVLKKRWL